MSKRFRKIPLGPILGHFVVFGEDDWKAMESENVFTGMSCRRRRANYCVWQHCI